jgi:phosphatidate phosphatase PAH1
VDGTLTENENAAFVALLTGPPPMANAGGPDVMRALVSRGYEVMYLTARPEWLEQGTHQWLSLRGFPRGIVHTTLGVTGALGAAAADFKTAELLALRMRFGRAPDYGFGNTDSDVTAYVRAGVASAFYYRFSGDLRGGSRVDDYNTLVPRVRALAPRCR